MNNYRGINLVSICPKVYNKILLNEIQIFVDPIPGRNQTFYRRRSSCTQQIHTLRLIIEGLQAKQLPLQQKPASKNLKITKITVVTCGFLL